MSVMCIRCGGWLTGGRNSANQRGVMSSKNPPVHVARQKVIATCPFGLRGCALRKCEARGANPVAIRPYHVGRPSRSKPRKTGQKQTDILKRMSRQAPGRKLSMAMEYMNVPEHASRRRPADQRVTGSRLRSVQNVNPCSLRRQGKPRPGSGNERPRGSKKSSAQDDRPCRERSQSQLGIRRHRPLCGMRSHYVISIPRSGAAHHLVICFMDPPSQRTHGSSGGLIVDFARLDVLLLFGSWHDFSSATIFASTP